MSEDDRDVLQVLGFELKFTEDGGYRRSLCSPSKPPSIFQDSPTCLNFGQPARVRPCDECVLMKFVPPERRAAAVPCHHIPLNHAGETIGSLDLQGDREALEVALQEWLRSTIRRVEQEPSCLPSDWRIKLDEFYGPQLGRKRVLIVDNDELLLIALEALLRSAGCEVASAREAEEALHLLHRRRPNLILWGPAPSESASEEMLKQFHAVAPDVPVIVMQGTGARYDSSDRYRCFGVWSIVSKREPERIMALLKYRMSLHELTSGRQQTI